MGSSGRSVAGGARGSARTGVSSGDDDLVDELDIELDGGSLADDMQFGSEDQRARKSRRNKYDKYSKQSPSDDDDQSLLGRPKPRTTSSGRRSANNLFDGI